MCDIDNFKKYNDTYGHLKGDETLIKVSNSLKNSLNRPNDFAFRLGGEEFGIIISNMKLESVRYFAQKIKNSVEELEIRHRNNDNVDVVTISMGIAYMKNLNIFSNSPSGIPRPSSRTTILTSFPLCFPTKVIELASA